jgi:hypothetical protein
MVNLIAITRLRELEGVCGRKTILVMAKSTKDNTKTVSYVATADTSGQVAITT